MENKNIEVRFPNESFYDKINIENVVDFKASKKFSD